MGKKSSKLLAVLCIAALFASCLCPVASAADTADSQPTECDSQALVCTEVPIYEDDRYLGIGFITDDDVTLVPLRTFLEAVLDVEFEVEWEHDSATATLTSADLLITLTLSDGYMCINGRYIYLRDSVYNINGTIIVPIRDLATLFGLEPTWDAEEHCVILRTENLTMPVCGDEFYPAEDLYWLSHVIYSESGNQPLDGMIGVGNVVMNRAADDSGAFNSGIQGVIFQQGQFDVVAAGTIYYTPSDKAVVAAKLCLEGYNTVGDAKWFVNPAIGSSTWFRTYKTLAITIADHDFYA